MNPALYNQEDTNRKDATKFGTKSLCDGLPGYDAMLDHEVMDQWEKQWTPYSIPDMEIQCFWPSYHLDEVGIF